MPRRREGRLVDLEVDILGSGIELQAEEGDFYGFALGRFDNGQLVEGWNCFDFLGMYQQCGVPLHLPPG